MTKLIKPSRKYVRLTGSCATQVELFSCDDMRLASEGIRPWALFISSSPDWKFFTTFDAEQSGGAYTFGYWTDSTKFGLCWEEAAGL